MPHVVLIDFGLSTAWLDLKRVFERAFDLIMFDQMSTYLNEQFWHVRSRGEPTTQHQSLNATMDLSKMLKGSHPV